MASASNGPYGTLSVLNGCALLVVTAIGAVFLLPSLLWLYATFQRTGEEKPVS